MGFRKDVDAVKAKLSRGTIPYMSDLDAAVLIAAGNDAEVSVRHAAQVEREGEHLASVREREAGVKVPGEKHCDRCNHPAGW